MQQMNGHTIQNGAPALSREDRKNEQIMKMIERQE